MATLTIALLKNIYRRKITHFRLTLESWFTSLEQTSLNRSQQAPPSDFPYAYPV